MCDNSCQHTNTAIISINDVMNRWHTSAGMLLTLGALQNTSKSQVQPDDTCHKLKLYAILLFFYTFSFIILTCLLCHMTSGSILFLSCKLEKFVTVNKGENHMTKFSFFFFFNLNENTSISQIFDDWLHRP